jgi:porphobilinogen synthase
MSYSTKFASAYYGPFRHVAQSSPDKGDRQSYQMNVANRLEAVEESLQDELQGADILMVKPALSFLDIIRDIKNSTNLPIAAYNVSGEYAMLKLAQKHKLIDYDKVMFETLLSMKRAGAGIIITYHAKEICRLLDL